MALEKVEHEVASEESVIQEVAKELKTVKADILDSLSSEQKNQANPSAIVEDRESQQQLTSVESLSDKEKLQQIQKSFTIMHEALERTNKESIVSGEYVLSIQTSWWYGEYSNRAVLKESGKEVLIFEIDFKDSYKKEYGYFIKGAITLAGQKNMLSYNSDSITHDEKGNFVYPSGIYSHYEVFEAAQPYMKIIHEMINNKNKKPSVKK